MAETSEVERVKREVVVTGKVYSTNGKVCLIVRPLDVIMLDIMADEPERIYAASKFKGHVGHIYTYETTLDGSSYWPGSVRWVQAWPNEAERLLWEAQGRAFDVAHDARAKARNAENANLIKERLKPLREAYLLTNAQGRRALIALVIEYMQNGDVF